MQLTEQFGLRKTLDHLFQLIFISTNLFETFDFQDELSFLKIGNNEQYTDSDLKSLLTYFLDLIEFFSHERLHLIQDPADNSRYALSGGF